MLIIVYYTWNITGKIGSLFSLCVNDTLLETNISHPKARVKMIFLFHPFPKVGNVGSLEGNDCTQVGEWSTSPRFAMCHEIFFNTSPSKHPQIQGCFSNQNEGFPSTNRNSSNFSQWFCHSFFGFKPYFFGNAGLVIVVSIDLAMCPIFFPLCWLDPSSSRAGAKSGDDGTSSPSKDGSDDTRTCCLPTGANFEFWKGKSWYIYIIS